MSVNFSKFKKHEKYVDKTYGEMNNANIVQKVQATYENNMRQAEAIKGQSRENSMRTNMINRANEIGKSFNNKSNNRLASLNNPLIPSKNKINLNAEQLSNLSQMDKKEARKMVGALPVGQNEKNKLNVQVDSLRRSNENTQKANKINEDIENGKYGSSIKHILSGVPNEAMNSIVNTGTMLASLNPKTKDGENLVSTAKSLTKGYQERNSMIDNNVVKTAGTVSGAIGNMAPAIATSIFTGGAGIAPNAIQGLGVMSSEYLNTLNDEQNNKVKSFFTGLAKGGVSMATEKLTGGNIISKGSIDDIVKNKLAKSTLSNGKKWLASKAYEFGGEIAEENLENLAGYLIDYAINQKGTSLQDIIKDAKQTSVDTFWTTLTLNALGLGGNTYKEVKQQEYNSKTNERNKLIDNSNLGENSKAQLKRLSEKNNWTVENLKNMLEEGGNLSNQKVIQNKTDILSNNELLQNNQQITQKQNKTSQNENMKQINQIKIDSENFAKQVDAVKNGSFPKKDMLTLGKTPQVLKDIGLPDLPITITQKHLDTIMNETGKYKNANYHGLGEDIIKQLPEAINNPLDIVKSNTKDDSIVLTTYLADKQDRTVVASIKIDGKGIVNDIRIDTNVMTSAYGRNNYEKFMEQNIKNGNLLYDVDRGVIKKLTGQGYNYLDASTSVDTVDNVSTLNNIIPQNENKMQVQNEKSNNEKNSPQKEISTNPKVEGKLSLDQTNPFISDNITDMYREEINQGKNRKHYKTVFQSEAVGEVGKKASKELFAKDTYVPISNQKTITEANDDISRIGEENSYIALRTKIARNEKITLQDIATGERLIQIYSQQGDYTKVQDLIQDVAILGTELGQQVQALSLIKKMSPEGQLQMLTKIVERTNQKKSNTNLEVTEDMARKILESKNQEELDNTMTEVAKELGEQLPVTIRDEIRSWRYFSMLGNPRTHIRNIGANVVMNITKTGKDLVAGGVEDVVSVFNKNMERTKTLKRSSKEQIQFAKQDAEYMKDLIDGGGKYDIQNMIESNSRSSNMKALNAVEEFNTNLLDVEDKIFLKLAYQQSLQNYMTANKLNPSDMTGKTLEKARQYASHQAQEATFHQFSALANTLTQIENKGGIGGKLIEAVLPFKKTPINIAKSGIEYSPIGLAKSLTYDLNNIWSQTDEYKNMLEQGKISQEEYHSATSKLLTKQIDSMAKGLTGTAIATIGYFLAQSGILKAGNDGDDDEFEEGQGKQEYSIQIGDTTYSLDWVSPSAIPLFIGATIQDLISGDEEFNDNYLNAIATSLAKSVEPMTEMSMLQNLTSAISSYEQGSSNMIFDLGASATTSYLGQFLPTAMSQTTKVIDPNVRDTSSTKKRNGKKG